MVFCIHVYYLDYFSANITSVEIVASLSYKTSVNAIITVVNWKAGKNRWRVILFYLDLYHWTTRIPARLSSKVEFKISSGQVQNQREGKVSTNGKQRKVSNIYYWMVLLLFEFTTTYRSRSFKFWNSKLSPLNTYACFNSGFCVYLQRSYKGPLKV